MESSLSNYLIPKMAEVMKGTLCGFLAIVVKGNDLGGGIEVSRVGEARRQSKAGMGVMGVMGMMGAMGG
jgi:hypothetical protein